MAEYISLGELDEKLNERVEELRKDPLSNLWIVLNQEALGLKRRLRELLLVEREAIAGVEIITSRQVSPRILSQRGKSILKIETGHRELALEALIQGSDQFIQDQLSYFEFHQLRGGHGYASAFAQAFSECERAGIRPENFKEVKDERLKDLRKLWKKTEEFLGWSDRFEREVVLSPTEALDRLSEIENLSEAAPPGLVILDDPSDWEKEILEEVASQAGWPVLELKTASEFSSFPPAPEEPRALDNIKRYFYRRQDNPTPPPASDDSVRFEEYASPEKEREQAIQWALEALDEGIPPHKIGILVPESELARPVYDQFKHRIKTLEPSVEVPLQPGEGFPLGELPYGPDIILLLKTLEQALRQEEMVRLLGKLNLDYEEDVYPLNQSHWRSLIYQAGMVGASRARSGDIDSWQDDFNRYIETLEERINRWEIEEDEEDKRKPRDFYLYPRRRAGLKAAKPAVDELVEMAAGIYGPRPLSLAELWDRINSFWSQYLVPSQSRFDYREEVDEKIGERIPPEAGEQLQGEEALRLLQAILTEIRLPPPESAGTGIYIGTISSARYRRFDALRVIGLTENQLPDVPRQDPVLPDRLREQLSEQLPTSRDRVKKRLRHLHQLIESTSRQAVFTTVRQDGGGIKRAPSSLFVELALAAGKNEDEIPDDSYLESEMARGRKKALRDNYPLDPSGQVQTGEETTKIPGYWKDGSLVLDLDRIDSLQAENAAVDCFSGLDGHLPDAVPERIIPGLTAKWELSASSLKKAMQCPHRLLLQKVLSYREPPEPPPVTELSSLDKGSLLHRCMEKIYSSCPASRKQIAGRVEEVCRHEFEQFMEEHTLVGADVRKRELENLIELSRRLVENEESVIFRREMELEKSLHSQLDEVYIRGYLDRLERDKQGSYYIRDLKSGSAKTDQKLLYDQDAQLGLYYWLVKEELGEVAEVSYLYPKTPWHFQRKFSSWEEEEQDLPLADLARCSRDWINLVGDLLDRGYFPRTEEDDDCKYCPFTPVCGGQAPEKAKKMYKNQQTSWQEKFLARKDVPEYE